MAKGKKTGGRDWKPGQSGNPNGRPKKGETLTDLMREFLDHVPEGQKVTYKELFIKKVMKMALANEDMAAIKLIWNYLDGMPRQSIDHTSKGEAIKGFNYIIPEDKK